MKIWSFINVTRMKEQIYIYIDDTCMKYIYVIPVCVFIVRYAPPLFLSTMCGEQKRYIERKHAYRQSRRM